MNRPLGVLDCRNHGFIWLASWCVWDYPEDRPEILNVFRIRYVYTELRDRDDIPLLLEGNTVSSFKLVWIESIFSSNSLIGYSLKCRCCSLVWPKSLLSKTGFDRQGRYQSSFRLSALVRIYCGGIQLEFFNPRFKLGHKIRHISVFFLLTKYKNKTYFCVFFYKKNGGLSDSLAYR